MLFVKSIIFKRIFKVILFFIFILITLPLYSQSDIEKATRETDRFKREDLEEKLRKIPEKPPEVKPEEVPPQKEEQKFFIKRIDLRGCESFPLESFSFLMEKYENKEVTLSELEALTKEIEREYLRRGIIAAVFIPAQEIKEETIILQVVEARLGRLNIQEHKYFKKERIAYYWKIPEGEILRYDKISQGLQMMNKNPDREVRAALSAGKKPGTTDILLTPKTSFPIHFTSTFDREGSTATGRSRIGTGLRHSNFLGLDDTLLTGYSFGKDFSGIYTYHNLPISSNGASVVYGYSRSESKPAKEFASFGLKSEAKSVSLSLRQDLYKKEDYIGEVFVGFEAKDKTVKQNTDVTNRDRLRIFSLGGNFIQRGFGSNTSLSLELSQGIPALGASSKYNSLISRGATSRFSKFNLGIQHKKLLPLNLQANLKLKTQVSSTKLTPQEEFSLGGIDSVRGYPSGDYLADYAVLTSSELLIPSFFIPQNWRLPYAKESLREQTTTLVFVDYGWGERRGALPTEKETVNLLGMGAGFRIKLFDQALLRLEWGFPIGGNRTITEVGSSRFHLSLDFQEKLPEEIERIRQLIEEENIKQWALRLVNEELARMESPIRKKISNYRSLAETRHRQGRLKEAAELYKKAAQINRSLYQQAEDYVRACIAQQKEVKKSYKLALTYYKEGKLDEAKQIWQKVIDGAKPKPLILEF